MICAKMSRWLRRNREEAKRGVAARVAGDVSRTAHTSSRISLETTSSFQNLKIEKPDFHEHLQGWHERRLDQLTSNDIIS
jgi:hypothetical protein